MMSRLLFVLLVSVLFSSYVTAHETSEMMRYKGVIIDPHTQIDHEIDNGELLEVIRRSSVSKLILCSIYNRKQKSVLELAKKYPDLIVPAIRTKTRAYVFSPDKYDEFRRGLERQAEIPAFGALQELLGYHAIKPKHAHNEPKEILAPPLDKKIAIALELAKRRGWPLVLHYEFASLDLARRNLFFSQLDDLLTMNSGHSFVLTHLGQLEYTYVERLILKHKNLHFTLAETNRCIQNNFVCTFERHGRLKQEWQRLLETYPDRFILSIDGVFRGIWLKNYSDYIDEWRLALGQLPEASADLIAHGNAQRLWPSLR
jgi:predicted TIM-barrel fold metal-dependent hydrolase